MARPKQTHLNLCRICGAPIPRRPHEDSHTYNRRTLCGSPACRGAVTKEAWRNRALPGDDESICACGQPATITMWVVQLNAEGYRYNVQMRYCPECALLEPDGYTGPRELTDDEERRPRSDGVRHARFVYGRTWDCQR